MKNFDEIHQQVDSEHEAKDFYTVINESLHMSYNGNWIEEFRIKLKKKQMKNPSKVKVLSLFSGGGGLDIGFEDAGFEIVESVEIDKNCAITLQTNITNGNFHENGNIRNVDIRQYNPSHLIGEVDFIIGGPPCQTFSAAGRRAAGVLGTTDDRGTLFEEYVRILETLQPRGFLFENVSGVLGSEKGESWKQIQKAFSEVGYKIHFRVLDTADYGVPQFRERLFIVGTKNSEDYLFPRPTHGPDSVGQIPHFTAEQAIRGVSSSPSELSREVNGKYGYLLKEVPPGLNYSFFTEKMGHPVPIFAWRSKFSDFLYKADPKMPVRTLKAQGGQYTGPFHWENRPFTIGELKRLQTFPDNYVIEGGKGAIIKQIGNSVPPQIARILALSVLEQIFEVESPFYIEKLQENEILGFKSRKTSRTKMYEQIASEWISRLEAKSKTSNIISRAYFAMLDPINFKWTEVKNEIDDNVLNVEVKNEAGTLNIKAFEKKSDSDFVIEITPTSVGWDIGFEKILLTGEKLDERIFVALWKALEYELSINNVKADLVQLSGYYQYKPAFNCKMVYLKGDFPKDWWIVSQVLLSEGVPKIKSAKDLASEWGIKEDSVLEKASFLKRLGFEIRNKNTNPQIPLNHFLIPYKFPSLNPLSVQLQKRLGDR